MACAHGADLPSPAPAVTRIFPHGVARGSTAEVVLGGSNLQDAQSIEFAGKGVTGEILGTPLGNSLKLRVTATTSAEAGRRDFRLTTKRGVYVGVFDIGALPEIREQEKNDDWRRPQPISLPVLVNGTIGVEDWDHFRFHAEAGETLIFDVSATRHGSRLDSDLALLDDRGREIAWVDDTTIFGDPHLAHTFQQAGDYVIRVGSLGGGGADYRLSVGKLPYVTRVFPAGLRAGAATELSLTGTHLDLVDEVWIGDRAAKGALLASGPNALRVRFQLPQDFAKGAYKIHAMHRGQEVAIPTEIRVSHLREVTVSQAPRTLSSALAIDPSVVLNGVIENPKASHYFRLEAKAGERYVFSAESMKLGYHLDPTITVLDSEGKALAYGDDPGMDERSDEYQLDPDLSFEVKQSGTYYVSVRDGMYRGGDQMLYRLTARRASPDFLVELREAVKSLYEGQESTLLVRVRRRAGWNTPVDVWAEGLPAGVTVERQTAAPEDSVVKDTCGVDRVVDGTIVTLPVRVSQAPEGRFPFVIKARGTWNGRVVEHTATVHYQRLTAGYVYGPMEVQKAELSVTRRPDIILGTPVKVVATAGAETQVAVKLERVTEAAEGPVAVRLGGAPTGITAPPAQAGGDAKTVTISLKAQSAAANAPIFLQAVSPSGKVLGESAPFELDVKSEDKAER